MIREWRGGRRWVFFHVLFGPIVVCCCKRRKFKLWGQLDSLFLLECLLSYLEEFKDYLGEKVKVWIRTAHT